MLLTLATGTARAQAPDPNPGAITLTTGIDFPSVYFFRGIRQEADPSFTMFAFGDVGIALHSSDTGKSVSLNFGVWNSLHTGTSGTGTTDKKSHYEEDFYVMLNLGVGKGITITPFFTVVHEPERFVRHGERVRVQGRAREQVRALRDRRLRVERAG